MQFMKTLFWMILAAVLVIFGMHNWSEVDVNLWGGLTMGVKLPILVLIAFLIGFLPTWVIYRARLWSLQRRLDAAAQAHVVSYPAPAPPKPTATANTPVDRQATDAKAWPAQ